MKIRKNGKVINLTESDLQRIVKRLISEQIEFNEDDGDLGIPERHTRRYYLDSVVTSLINDTKIEYVEQHNYELIYMPFHSGRGVPIELIDDPEFGFFHRNRFPTSTFSNYCKDMYELSEQEIEYVWHQYRGKVLDMI